MRQIETFAAEHGRDPGELDMILRVYPQEAATMDDAVEFLDRAEREAGVTQEPGGVELRRMEMRALASTGLRS